MAAISRFDVLAPKFVTPAKAGVQGRRQHARPLDSRLRGGDEGKGMKMIGELRVTEALAAFLVASRWEDIPAAVRHEGMRSLLNFVGGALGGCRDEAVSLAATVLTPYFGASPAHPTAPSPPPHPLNPRFPTPLRPTA